MLGLLRPCPAGLFVASAITPCADGQCCGLHHAQVEVLLHAPGAPRNTRTLQLTRQKVTINPVTYTTCSNVAAAALPPGEGSTGWGGGGWQGT
jgi:hypothetical protein